MEEKIKCMVFFCKKHSAKVCCKGCEHREKCSNPCLNSPERCNLVDDFPKPRRYLKGADT